jgi:hypothetical protein
MDESDRRRLRYLSATLKRHSKQGTLWRPNGAVIVNVAVRLLRTLALNNGIPFTKGLTTMSKESGISEDELRYLSDMGEWLLLDRGVREMDDEEYDEFWETDDIDLRGLMLTAPGLVNDEVEELRLMWGNS